MVNGAIEKSYMECLNDDNYFGKLLGPHTDVVMKVMRFSQVLANVALEADEFNRLLGGALLATGFPLRPKKNK